LSEEVAGQFFHSRTISDVTSALVHQERLKLIISEAQVTMQARALG